MGQVNSLLGGEAEGRGAWFFFFFFPWMVNTGILETQEKELGVGDRRGTWLHEVGLELVGEGEQKGEPDSRHRERWAGLRTLRRSAQETWSGRTFRGALATKLLNTTKAEGGAETKGGDNCSEVVRPGKMKLVRWEREGASGTEQDWA